MFGQNANMSGYLPSEIVPLRVLLQRPALHYMQIVMKIEAYTACKIQQQRVRNKANAEGTESGGSNGDQSRVAGTLVGGKLHIIVPCTG